MRGMVISSPELQTGCRAKELIYSVSALNRKIWLSLRKMNITYSCQKRESDHHMKGKPEAQKRTMAKKVNVL